MVDYYAVVWKYCRAVYFLSKLNLFLTFPLSCHPAFIFRHVKASRRYWYFLGFPCLKIFWLYLFPLDRKLFWLQHVGWFLYYFSHFALQMYKKTWHALTHAGFLLINRFQSSPPFLTASMFFMQISCLFILKSRRPMATLDGGGDHEIYFFSFILR